MNTFIKLKQRSYLSLLVMLGILSVNGNLNADVHPGNHATGMRIPTEKQLEELNHLPKVVGVNPNKIGVVRIASYLKTLGALPVESFNLNSIEIITDRDESAMQYLSAITVLPTSVDNSTLPCFPPIGDQGQEGSCAAFGSTYYHATHEIGLMNGYNNKTSSTYILSPKWTYNMCNYGGDYGAWPADAYTLLAQNGAPSIVSFPYTPTNVLMWDLNTQDWIAAMSNRTTPAMQVTGIGGASQNLTQIKQLLANGHVLTFATYAYSWQFTQIQHNPNAGADNSYVGQYAISWMNGQAGGHFVTIVGYNDNVWIDVNGNGVVDPGEMGAFLIANSWGNWANNGFVWMSYDGFLSKSAVVNGPSSGRMALASFLNNIVFSMTAKAANYKPTLVAEFGLTTSARNQISISGGVSTTSQATPTAVFPSGAINYQGGVYDFNGMTGSDTATFALDLTDLSSSTGQNRYYFIATDYQGGGVSTVNSYSLIDYTRNVTLTDSKVPVSFQGTTVYLYLDDLAPPPPAPVPPPPPAPVPPPPPAPVPPPPPAPVPPPPPAPVPPPPPPIPTKPVVTITSPLNNSTVSGTVAISTTVTGNSLPIAWVALYVDDNLVLVDTKAPYTFLYDSTNVANGKHTFWIVAEDTKQNYGQITIDLIVENAIRH